MKFSNRIGKVDDAMIIQAEKILTKIFFELSLRVDDRNHVTGLGGDPFYCSLLNTIEHTATLNIPTAATNGSRFFWNPKFILKLTPIGVRIVSCHEALHSQFMHPNRVGGRKPKLWNIAVDFIVHKIIIEDLAARTVPNPLQATYGSVFGREGAAKLFKQHLGDYMTISDYSDLILNSKSVKDFPKEIRNQIDELLKQGEFLASSLEDKQLTDDQKKSLERQENKKMRPVMDPNMTEEFGTPEKLYNHLLNLYHIAEKKFGKDIADGIFSLGDTLDDHFDCEVSEKDIAKRIYNASEIAKKSGGKTPAGLDDEIDQLLAPVLRWQDKIKSTIQTIREGDEKNNWSTFKSKKMIYGVYEPRRFSNITKFHALCDTSGSMTIDDITFAVSQLAAFRETSVGNLVPADSEVYWENTLKLEDCTTAELSKFKVKGRGGTVFRDFFENYKKELGDADFLVILTDGYLTQADYVDIAPKIPVYWIITSENTDFEPPFGKVYNLYDHRL